MHYLLGHENEAEGPLELPVDEMLELKVRQYDWPDFAHRTCQVDYGKDYERVRVRKRYARVKGDELRKIRQDIEKDDAGFLEDCATKSSHVIHQQLDFLQRMKAEIRPSRTPTESAACHRGLCFLVAIAAAKLGDENCIANARKLLEGWSDVFGANSEWKKSLLAFLKSEDRIFAQLIMKIVAGRECDSVESFLADLQGLDAALFKSYLFDAKATP